MLNGYLNLGKDQIMEVMSMWETWLEFYFWQITTVLGIGGRADSEGLKMKAKRAIEGYYNREIILQVTLYLK